MFWLWGHATTPATSHYKNTPVEVIYCVNVHPVSVDLLESEVLRGWGVTLKISLSPSPYCGSSCGSFPPLFRSLLISGQGGGYFFQTNTPPPTPLGVPVPFLLLVDWAALFSSLSFSYLIVVPTLSDPHIVESGARRLGTTPGIGMSRRCSWPYCIRIMRYSTLKLDRICSRR